MGLQFFPDRVEVDRPLERTQRKRRVHQVQNSICGAFGKGVSYAYASSSVSGLFTRVLTIAFTHCSLLIETTKHLIS
jgi:hypothetical protein